MKSGLRYILFVLASSIFAAIGYLMTSNIAFPVVILISYSLLLSFVLCPMERRRAVREKKRHEAYRFVTSFVVSYSLTSSFERAYGNAIEGYSGEYQEIIETISSEDTLQRIRYLEKYFESKLYSLFINMLDIYVDQGGDAIDVFSGIVYEFTKTEEEEDGLLKEKKRSLRDFVLLWTFSFAIFVFLRFGLNSFYDDLLKSVMFLSSIALFFVFFAFSCIFFWCRYCDEKPNLKFWRKHRG